MVLTVFKTLVSAASSQQCNWPSDNFKPWLRNHVQHSCVWLLLFVLATAMNSISSEFESGTIVPLLTKPVSRTMVFLGKLFAAFVIIIITYSVLRVRYHRRHCCLWCSEQSPVGTAWTLGECYNDFHLGRNNLCCRIAFKKHVNLGAGSFRRIHGVAHCRTHCFGVCRSFSCAELCSWEWRGWSH